MKKLLSNTLLCGVLASSFMLVNCQKAPNREVKAQTGVGAKPTAAPDVLASCNDAVLAAKTARDKALSDLSAKVAEAKAQEGGATEAQKADLRRLSTDLQSATDTLTNAITALSASPAPQIEAQAPAAASALPASGEPSAPAPLTTNGCNIMDSKDATKVAGILRNAALADETAKAVSGAKAISDPTVAALGSGDGSGSTDDLSGSSDSADASSLQEKAVVTPSAELGAALKPDNKNGLVYISEGKITEGAANYQAALASNDKTTCSILEAPAPLVDQNTLEVVAISDAEVLTGPDHSAVTVELKAGGDDGSLYALSCAIPKSLASDINGQLRSALGGLATVKAPAAAQ